MKRGQRGNTLALTMVLVSLALILCLAMSSASVSQLHLASKESSSKRAEIAAESVIALVTERLLTTPDLIESGTQTEFEVEHGDAKGRISFVSSAGLPQSYSNLTGTTPLNGWQGHVVPPRSVQLIAVGESGARRETIEVVLHIPEFPFALASEGPISSNGGLLIGGVDSVAEAISSLNPVDLKPADLVSNAQGTAIELDGQGAVTGDIKAVGQIQIGPDMVVSGSIRNGSDAESIAEIDFDALKPDFSLAFVNKYSPKVEDSRHFNQPNLSIGGGLELDDGILFVNGDLHVQGGLRGRGAIVVNGKLEVDGGAALAASDQVALVAKEDIVIRGSTKESSFFQGLIYTEGDLRAENITLLGSFVANRDGDSTDPGSKMQLQNSRVVHLPSFSRFESVTADYMFKGILGAHDQKENVEMLLRATDKEVKELEDVVEKHKMGIIQAQNHQENSSGVHAKAYQDYLMEVGPILEKMGVRQPLGRNYIPPRDPDNPRQIVFSPEVDLLASLLIHARFGEISSTLEPTATEGIQRNRFTFDLNEFLQPSSRIRVVSWRKH